MSLSFNIVIRFYLNILVITLWGIIFTLVNDAVAELISKFHVLSLAILHQSLSFLDLMFVKCQFANDSWVLNSHRFQEVHWFRIDSWHASTILHHIIDSIPVALWLFILNYTCVRLLLRRRDVGRNLLFILILETGGFFILDMCNIFDGFLWIFDGDSWIFDETRRSLDWLLWLSRIITLDIRDAAFFKMLLARSRWD